MTIADSDVKETEDTLTIGFLTWSKKTGELVSMKPEGRSSSPLLSRKSSTVRPPATTA